MIILVTLEEVKEFVEESVSHMALSSEQKERFKDITMLGVVNHEAYDEDRELLVLDHNGLLGVVANSALNLLETVVGYGTVNDFVYNGGDSDYENIEFCMATGLNIESLTDMGEGLLGMMASADDEVEVEDEEADEDELAKKAQQASDELAKSLDKLTKELFEVLTGRV